MWNQSKHLRNLSVQMAPEVITENLNFQTFPDPGHKKYVTPTVLLSITDIQYHPLRGLTVRKSPTKNSCEIFRHQAK